MSDQKYRLYLQDLGQILNENAKTAKERASEAPDQEYRIGYQMAYHDVLSILLSQAKAFQIDPEDLNLSEVQPERDLL